MQRVFFLVVYYSWFCSLYTFQNEDVMKPSFTPYCSTRDICKSACECAFATNCTLLQMDSNIRKEVLSYINKIRNIHARGEPQPSGLPMLLYNFQLEDISSCWSVRCENTYSECFFTPHFSETSQTVGRILIHGKIPTLNLWYEILNFWLGEYKLMTAEAVRSLPAGGKGEKIHNYAQLLTDRTLYIGCSWSMSSAEWVTLVCTYGPRGPLQGEAVYRTGPSCSSCPKGYTCNNKNPYNNLCTPIGVHTSTSTASTSTKPKASERKTYSTHHSNTSIIGFNESQSPLPEHFKKATEIRKRKKLVKKQQSTGGHLLSGFSLMVGFLLIGFIIIFIMAFAGYTIVFV
ncbi:hypothetical protein HHI36_012450 [Cryptolaemus montrouzieri]|uniref:SCP domain-containing protein n=1 Tax=Cryptolaemus montrouzieri TaxID=559131 RepID=A0ABD2NFG1_9CUCU